MKKVKRLTALLLSLVLLLAVCACGGEKPQPPVTQTDVGQTGQEPERVYDIEGKLAEMTLQQKAAQMVQGAVYSMNVNHMMTGDYGSILSNISPMGDAAEWRKIILTYQNAALMSECAIPYVYGNDAVHGHNTVLDTTIFPHNIGLGAANDPDSVRRMAELVADEMKLSGVLWNFSPCVTVPQDPRWGRTYEGYSSDVDIVTALGKAYTEGMVAAGVMPCPKHFIADGHVVYGTGEDDMLIDRGEAQLTEAEIDRLLEPYIACFEAGARTVMISHSSLNGLKMHASTELITDVLKGELGFEGFVVSDWESIQHIEAASLKEQVGMAINAGIDMLMQPDNYAECSRYIVELVNEGVIPQERVDDAVTRILTVKRDMGVLTDPLQEFVTTEYPAPRAQETLDLAAKLAAESQVLLKNDGALLPLKSGTKVYVIGPAADDLGAQCGGWTLIWQGQTDKQAGRLLKGTTILEALKATAADHGLTIVSDPAEADMVLLCVGEKPYAEWEGDTADLSLTGALGLPGNQEAIDEAAELGLPTATLILAGRNVLISEYLDGWDAVVMGYLPGTEGQGVASVLVGDMPFTGKLPMPWYASLEQIRTDECLFPLGYGLSE